MAVTFTPNLGLAKPTESELASNWVGGTQLMDDNNLILEDNTDVNLITYTPALICNTTNPSVGAGNSKGEYHLIGSWIFGDIVINFVDPGVSSGSGTGGYGISLPFPADGTFHTVGTALTDVPGVASCIGEGHFRDSSTTANSGTAALDVVTVGGVSYARIVTETFVGKTNALFIPGQPFSLATGDCWLLNFVYKKA